VLVHNDHHDDGDDVCLFVYLFVVFEVKLFYLMNYHCYVSIICHCIIIAA
jgi:hypothetical protein